MKGSTHEARGNKTSVENDKGEECPAKSGGAFSFFFFSPPSRVFKRHRFVRRSVQTRASSPSHNCCFRSFLRFPVYRSVSPSWKNPSFIIALYFPPRFFTGIMYNSLDRILLFTLSVEKCIQNRG